MATATLMCAAGALVAVSAPASALSDGLKFSAIDAPTWQTNGTVWALAQSQGTVFAGGTFTTITPPAGGKGNAIEVTSLASFDAATGEPTSCRPTLYSSSGTTTVRALTMSPDGKTLYIGGHFTHVNGTPVARLAALDVASCTLTSFRPGAISATVRAIAATKDTVYFGGDFNTVSGQQRGKFAAVEAGTARLLPWTADVDQPGRAVAVSTDGNKVAIGGDFFTVNGAAAHSLAVVDASSGALLKGFGSGNNTTTQIPRTSVTKAITTDGTGFYAGNEGTGGGVFDGKLALDYSTLDQRWRDLCLGANQALVVEDSTLYSANHSHDCSLMGWQTDGRRVYLQAQTTAAPTQSIAWKPELNDGIGEGIGPRALVAAEKGGKTYLWAGGEFTRTNGKAQRGLTHFTSGPASAAPDVPSRVTAESLEAGTIQVRWRTSSDNDDGRLTYRIYRDGSATPLATVTADAAWWHQPQASFIDKDVQPGRSYSYRVTASDGNTTTSLSATAQATAATQDVPYASRVLKDGADLYWRYNEQNDSYGADSSPGNKHVRYFGSPELRAAPNAVAGEDGYAAGFDGVDDYALNDTFSEGPTEYSIETWFKTGTTRGGKLVGFGNGNAATDNLRYRASSSYDRHVYMTNDGKLVYGVYANSAVALSTAASYNDNKWHQVVATQGPAGMRLYVDGAVVGKNGTTSAQAYRGSWRVGGDNLNGWPNRPSSDFFAGQIDETAIYPSALNPLQVSEHYAAAGGTSSVPEAPKDAYGAAVFSKLPDFFWRFDQLADGKASDAGIFGNDGTLNGDVGSAADGAIGKGADLGGTGYVSTAVATSPSPSYTAELWFATRASTGGRLIGFSSNNSGLSGNYDRHVYMRDDGSLVFGTWTGAENNAIAAKAYNDGAWHHLAASQSSDGMKLYVDGELVATNPQASAQSYNGYWRVGGDKVWGGASSDFLDGVQVDEAAAYSEALSAADIRSHYALGTGGTPPDTAAPTTPGGLKAAAEGNDVSLTWGASRDDTAVTGYTVHRSGTADFTADASNKVATTTTTGFTDPAPGDGTWHYQVIAHDAAGNQSDPATASVKISAPDTGKPTAPANLRASVTGTTVALAWDAAQDDTAVTGYTIHRGMSEGFTPSSGTKIGTAEGTSFSDKEVAPGTWYYRVVASDAAGNEGPPSSSTPALVKAPEPTGSTVTLAPTADAMVNQGAAGTNYGTSSQLASRGSLGYTSYLRFELPEAPTGTYLSAAQLDVRTTTATIAGSGDPHQVRLADDDWKEGTVTWNNRPELTGTPLGELPADSNPNTAYTIKLDPQALSGTSGDSTTLAVASLGTDNLWFWSKEQSSSALRPALKLTYTPGTAPEAPAPQPQPRTLDLAPTQDAMTNAAAASTNYGTVNQLASRGTPGYESFLGFELPKAPSGMTLSDAVLRVRTTTSDLAGSTDEHPITALSGTWKEDEVTHQNRPTKQLAALGTIAGGTKANTTYEVALDPEQVTRLLGTEATLYIGSTGNDNLWLWSREKSPAAQRPQLSLTFVAEQP